MAVCLFVFLLLIPAAGARDRAVLAFFRGAFFLGCVPNWLGLDLGAVDATHVKLRDHEDVLARRRVSEELYNIKFIAISKDHVRAPLQFFSVARKGKSEQTTLSLVARELADGFRDDVELALDFLFVFVEQVGDFLVLELEVAFLVEVAHLDAVAFHSGKVVVLLFFSARVGNICSEFGHRKIGKVV